MNSSKEVKEINNRILIITNNYPSITCGVGDYSFQLGNRLIESGYEILVICRNDNRILNYESRKKKVFPIIRKWSFKETKKVIEIINFYKPKCVLFQYVPHAYNKYGLSLVIPYYLKKISKLSTLVVTFHEVRIKINWFNLRSLLFGLTMKLIASHIVKNANSIITTNSFYTRLINAKSKTSLIRIPSNIDIKFIDNKRKKEIRYSFNILDSDIVLATFGLNPRGIDILLSTLEALIKKENSTYKLLLIGNYKDDVIKEVQKKIRIKQLINNVVITGFLSNESLSDTLQIVDIYLMLENLNFSTSWTGISTKSGTLACAFAAGLSVISIRGELTDDFFKHKENIFLLNNDSVDGVVEAITYLINNKKIAKKISKNAFISYYQELSWLKVIKEYLKIIEN